MKIYQITQTTSYNRYPNTRRQNSVNTCINSYNCSFKGMPDFVSSVKTNTQRVLNQAIDSISKSADKFQKNVVDPFYNKIFHKSTKSLKPQKAEKQVVPAAIKTADSIIPVPNFSMDYDRVLSDLKNIETIDIKWVKNNTPVLKAAFGYKDAEMSDHFFKIQAAEINRNRNIYIQDVKNLQTKEKAEYITGIWDEFLDVNPPYKPVNKEKNILGLQALQKYGTREDMLKLNDEYQLSKDSDIMKEYAKLVGNVGITKDALPLRAKTNKKKINLYNESTIEEIMKTLKKLMVDKAEKGYFVNASYSEYKDFERLSKHPNKSISDNARAIMKRISDENPWMLE